MSKGSEPSNSQNSQRVSLTVLPPIHCLRPIQTSPKVALEEPVTVTWGSGTTARREPQGSSIAVPLAHFVIGLLATKLESADPEPWEVHEDQDVLQHLSWRKLVAGLTKWMGMRKEYEFDGLDGVKALKD